MKNNFVTTSAFFFLASGPLERVSVDFLRYRSRNRRTEFKSIVHDLATDCEHLDDTSAFRVEFQIVVFAFERQSFTYDLGYGADESTAAVCERKKCVRNLVRIDRGNIFRHFFGPRHSYENRAFRMFRR